MAKTRHMHQRMGQRGVTQKMLDMVERFGTRRGDKHILDRKNIDQLVGEMDTLRSRLIHLRDKGGLVVIQEQGLQITTYRMNSFARHRAQEMC